MSPRRTRRGTIRESVIETSVDSSLKNTSKITKRSRRTNKSHTKASEDDSDTPVEIYSSIESVTSSSVLNDSSKNTKKRRKGRQEISVAQDNSLSVTIEEHRTKSRGNKSNAKTPSIIKETSRSGITESQALLSEEESSNVKTGKRVSYNLLGDSEDHPAMSSRKKTKLSKKEGKTPEKSPQRITSKNTTLSDKNVTPKSSPVLNVSFTPHRSKKTPKKSPINLGSPKTHSPNPTKLLIVPRKLSIVDSPSSSENSLQQSNSLNTANESILNTSKSSKKAKSKLNVSSSKKKSITPFKARPTFSKSPKIVLKTPKAKSSKKATPKGSTASAKTKKSVSIKQIKSDKTSKQNESNKDQSLSITQNISGLIDFNDTAVKSPQKSSKSSKKSLEATSPSKYKLDLLSSTLKNIPKIVLSSVSPKTSSDSPKAASPKKSKNSSQKASPNKSITSHKTKLPSISRGTPKIVLIKKSPVKSAKKTSPSKSHNKSPSKTKKTPSKSEQSSIDTSQESTEPTPPVKNDQSMDKTTSTKKLNKSLSPSKSKKSTKSEKSSVNISSKKTPNKSPSAGLPLSSKKMPKIVLTLKSKKSPLKSSRTPTSAKKSPKVASVTKSPKVLVKSLKTSPVSKVHTAPVKTPKKSSPSKNTSKNTTMSPKVVVSKLSSPDLKNNILRAKQNQPSITLVPVDHKSRTSTGRSPKSPTSAAKRKAGSPTKSPKSVAKKFMAANVTSKNATPSEALENKLLNLKPKNTSTPREKGKPIRSPLGKSKIIKRLNNQSAIKIQQPFLADESAPFFDDSSLIRMSDVFDMDTPKKNNTFDKNSSNTKSPRTSKTSQKTNKSATFEVEKSPKNNSRRSNRSGTFEVTKTSPSPSARSKSRKNNTYEVDEPKTPGLENKSTKRTLNQAGLGMDEEPSSKKSRKVNFASPTRGTARASSINRIGTPAHHMHQRKTPISVVKTKTPIKSAEVRSRVSSVGLLNKTPLSTPSSKRRSISIADPTKSRKSNYDAQVASVNRLSRPKAVTDSQKKLESKTPVGRKIPNFAEIHQKNFAKMESLVDLKKRVEKRHVVLNSASAKKGTPGATDSSNGAYNRFGFKLRKNEAVNLITKKQASADSREKKREDARSALKGVRMNRRFELQMKARVKTS